jgi:hypothetical protein
VILPLYLRFHNSALGETILLSLGIPLLTVSVNVFCRLILYYLASRVPSELHNRLWIYGFATQFSAAGLHRVLVTSIPSLWLQFLFCFVLGLVEIVARTTVAARDHIGHYLICCGRNRTGIVVDRTVLARIRADYIIAGMQAEYWAVISVSTLVTAYYGSAPPERFGSVLIQLLMSFLVDVVCCAADLHSRKYADASPLKMQIATHWKWNKTYLLTQTLFAIGCGIYAESFLIRTSSRAGEA